MKLHAVNLHSDGGAVWVPDERGRERRRNRLAGELDVTGAAQRGD